MAVEKFRAEFGVNHRLRWAFLVCQKLGIDDPIFWLNNTPHHVLDAWIAYEAYVADEEAKAYKNAGKDTIDLTSSSSEGALEGMIGNAT